MKRKNNQKIFKTNKKIMQKMFLYLISIILIRILRNWNSVFNNKVVKTKKYLIKNNKIIWPIKQTCY